MKNLKTTFVAAAVLATLASGSAFAQQAGDWQVGAGWLHLSPQDSSSPLRFTSPVNREVPGSGATVGNSDTLGLNATYFVDSHWAVEGVLGIPPKFKLYGAGTLGRLGELGEAKQWSPTILGKYYFGEGNDAFRPYVGLGATYVFYRSVNLTQSLQGGLAGQLGVPAALSTTSAKLDSSFAPVVMRLSRFALPVPADIAAYMARVEALPGVRAWVADALAEKDFVPFDEPYRIDPAQNL